MFRLGILIMLLPFCLSSCRDKPEPNNTKGSPIFYSSGKADGLPFYIAAGEGDYFMQTAFINNPVTIYQGVLKKLNCTLCGPSLEIKLNNYATHNNFVDSAFLTGNYRFFLNSSIYDTLYKIEMTNLTLGEGSATFNWDFANNTYSTQNSPTAYHQRGGIFQITQFANFPNCNSKLTQPIHLSPTRVGKHTFFKANYLDSTNLLFNAIPLDNNAQVTWDFGDGQTGTGALVKHQYLSSGQYRVCMEKILNGDTSAICQNINTQDLTKCIANYTYKTSMTVDTMHYSQVTVNWTDANGKVYSSANIEQPYTSVFKIISTKDYKPNERNERTKQLEVAITCLVSDGIQTILLSDVKGNLAVAHP